MSLTELYEQYGVELDYGLAGQGFSDQWALAHVQQWNGEYGTYKNEHGQAYTYQPSTAEVMALGYAKAVKTGNTKDFLVNTVTEAAIQAGPTVFAVAGSIFSRKQSQPAISLTEATERAIDHVGVGYVVETTKGGNKQYRTTTINANGQVETRIGRLDVNLSDDHVQREGPHLNLEVQINGKKVRFEPHSLPIDLEQ